MRHKTFPFIEQTCGLLDLTVLYDLGGTDEHPHTVYSVGVASEPAAGIHGFHVTPYFDSLNLLEDYLKMHYNKVLKATQDPNADIPDGLVDEWEE